MIYQSFCLVHLV